jgi:hypothetical protein
MGHGLEGARHYERQRHEMGLTIHYRDRRSAAGAMRCDMTKEIGEQSAMLAGLLGVLLPRPRDSRPRATPLPSALPF